MMETTTFSFSFGSPPFSDQSIFPRAEEVGSAGSLGNEVRPDVAEQLKAWWRERGSPDDGRVLVFGVCWVTLSQPRAG